MPENDDNFEKETVLDWKTFHIPLADHEITLREAYEKMKAVSNSQIDVPKEIQYVENPEYDNTLLRYFLNPFPGRVDLRYHDFIHLILGRGMLKKDEAFIIGFTMGSTNRMFTWRIRLYSWIAKYVYEKPWNFDNSDIRVFWDAAKAGWISDCVPLCYVEFNKYLDMKLVDIRKSLGIEEAFLKGIYEIHKARYPDDLSSQRLLDLPPIILD